MKPHVLLINVHGGFPSALIGRSLTELESFSHLCRDAVTYERMYPTNVCAAPALHDTVMDAPLASLTDNVRHSWGRQRQATRTIFHLFRQQGYDTRLYGAYGLDARLDARANMKVGVDERQALHAHGVDVCATADTAFADDHAPARARVLGQRGEGDAQRRDVRVLLVHFKTLLARELDHLESIPDEQIDVGQYRVQGLAEVLADVGRA